jgi:hypothetical protein
MGFVGLATVWEIETVEDVGPPPEPRARESLADLMLDAPLPG